MAFGTLTIASLRKFDALRQNLWVTTGFVSRSKILLCFPPFPIRTEFTAGFDIQHFYCTWRLEIHTFHYKA